jgi:hypothetical protein
MLQRDGVVMVVMKVLVMVMMLMMILMKSSLMVMTMATISPLRKGISPADFCLPESFLSLCCFRPAEAAKSIFDPLFRLRFLGMTIYAMGRWQKWGPGWPHPRVARPGAGPRHLVVWAACCSFHSLLLATFVF